MGVGVSANEYSVLYRDGRQVFTHPTDPSLASEAATAFARAVRGAKYLGDVLLVVFGQSTAKFYKRAPRATKAKGRP